MGEGRGEGARVALLVLALTPGCGRSCVGEPAPSAPRVELDASREDPMPVMLSARCEREIDRAAVSFPPGAGSIDTVAAACSRGSLALFVVRGHTLSRVERSTVAGSGYTPPYILSTGVDRLGPIAPDGLDGPLAWRSPLAGMDDERDDVWAASLSHSDAGMFSLRGDVLMPAGYVGLGVAVADRVSASGLDVFATFARAGEAPSTARLAVRLGRDTPDEPHATTRAFAGELKAWEATHRVALSRIEEGDATYLETARADGGASVRHRLASRHALVISRGVSVGERSAFLVGEFTLGREDAGACVAVGEGICVRPGALYALIVGPPGGELERVDIAPRGLPDSLAARGSELTALYVAPDEGPEQTAQRAARIDVAHREVTPLAFTPPPGFGAIDGPSLVGCDDGVWLAAEIGVPLGDSADAGVRTAVTALPLECLAR